MPEVNWDYDFKKIAANPNYNPPGIKSDKDWLIDLYKNILKREVDDSDDGHKYWMQEISKGADRASVLNYFKKVATDTNEKENQTDFEDMLDVDDLGKRIAVVLPQGYKDIFAVTSLLPSIKRLHPDYNIYFITNLENMEILDGNPHIHKVIRHTDQLDNPFTLEGRGDHKGYFEIAYFPNVATQKFVSYTHNCKDKTDFNLRCT